MYCAGLPFDGNTLKERSLGGSESMAYYAAKELANRGHIVKLFTNVIEESVTDGVHYMPIGPMTEQKPLGETFHWFAENTPCDILIIQRHPKAFYFKWASKRNYLWLHDLALKPHAHDVHSGLWQTDGVFAVSDWHKEQIHKVYKIPKEYIFTVPNCIDIDLYDDSKKPDDKVFNNVNNIMEKTGSEHAMIYSSRPERGLENLVGEGGIMERLLKEEVPAHLFVCHYDNTTPQMAGYYDYLWQRCNILPNVTLMGSLTKKELADVQRLASLHVYPTAFEETSCITVMECAAAGLPMLTTRVGNLKDYESYHEGMFFVDNVPNDENYHGKEIRLDSKVDIEGYTKKLIKLLKGQALYSASTKQEALKGAYTVYGTVGAMENAFEHSEKQYSSDDKKKAAIHWSDIPMFLEQNSTENAVSSNLDKEYKECYDFFIRDNYAEHYAKYYQYEKDRGVNYGPENLTNNDRFTVVSSTIAEELDSRGLTEAVILDYGCAHGHYTVNLARQFPSCKFIGIDIESTNIEKAKEWAAGEGLDNVEFYQGTYDNLPEHIEDASLDIIITAEVLEHVPNPHEVVNDLRKKVSGDGLIIWTLPQGPWEAEGYKEHWPWRAHIFHMERADLYHMAGMFREFSLIYIPNGFNRFGETVGNIVASFRNDTENEVLPVPENKLAYPNQTLSLCMIVKDSEHTIGRCLNSVIENVDEVIVGVDKTTTDNTRSVVESVCKENHVPLIMFDIDSPLETGFSVARNLTIDKASGSWIMWLDADEFVSCGDRIKKYLRNNMYDAYAIKQHHFSVEPLGILKTDLPYRLFRNNKDISFHGLVHEHPETTPNKGIERAASPPDIDIVHQSYIIENVRKGRFERNIGLMIREREENPDRVLSQFLWIRDLVQMAGWEISQNNGFIPPSAYDKALRATEMFEFMLDNEEAPERMIVDAIEFYNTAVGILGTGFPSKFAFNNVKFESMFLNGEHFKKLNNRIVNKMLDDIVPSKYG